MKKILVPTDFSRVADNALAYALAIGATFESELLLYHVYHISKVDYNRDYSADEQPFKKQLERRMEAVELKFQDTITEKGLKVETKVEREPILALFDRKVEEHDIDLIVMGSKGATGLKKVIFGSVAATALNMAKIPVLVIPPQHPAPPIKHIVLAVDHQEVSQETLSPLLLLAKAFHAKVTVLNVKTNNEAAAPSRTNFYLTGLETTYEEIPMSNSINDTINAFVEETDCDLLCMIRRDKGFFERLFQGSNTVNQAYNSQTPLLVLPDLTNA